MKKLIIFFTIAFLNLPYFALSQETRGNRLLDNWSLNINGGASIFWGDIRQYKFYPVYHYENERNISYGIILSKQLSPTFELRGQLIKGDLSGTKRGSTNRYFEGEIFEYNINTTINFSRLFWGINSDRKLSFYGIAGIGFLDFRVVKKVLGSNAFDYSRGYSKDGTVKDNMQTETVIPLGLGLKYQISKHFLINLENTFNVPNTDLLDATIGDFKYDFFSYTSLGLTYKFSKPEKKKKVIYKAPKVVEVKQTPVEPVKEEPKIEEPVVKKEEPKVVVKPVISNYEFKVQVFASKNRVGTAFIQKHYKITEPVREDYNGVLYRYSIGSFKKYAEASEKAKKLIAEKKILDAFVVGIKDGKRLDSFKELLSDEEKAILKPTTKQK